ncbi:MAG TPA: hypothetical protein VGL37_00735 [Solirubrobacteraceae bacterium]|jgi:hypothetical protein
MIRPVRLGLLVATSDDELTRAAQCAISSWGGIYTPFLDPGDRDSTLRRANALSVDAIYAAADDPAVREITATPGYQWVSRSPFGPYDEPNEYRPSRLLAANTLLGSIGHDCQLVHHSWAPTDPLALLFAVWFGAYGPSDFDHPMEAQFADRASEIVIDPGAQILPIEGLTPVQLTAAHVTYTGESTFDGFVVLDPSDPIDLARFWNARAYGGRVFPWPVGHSDRITEMALAWLDELRADGALNRWRRGDGTPLPPRVAVLLRPTDTAVPDELLALLRGANVDPFVEHEIELIGWNGAHPIQTRFSRTFSIDTAPSDWYPRIPLPTLPVDIAQRSDAAEMLVAAQISLSGESDPTATRWATLPNLRALSELLGRTPLSTPMHRPVSEGRVTVVDTTATDCQLELVPSHDAVATLFRGSQWSFKQSDNGVFATRLGTILGGPDTSAPMEPATREILSAVIRSPRGKTRNQLDAIARKHQANWPGEFLFADQEPNVYARGVSLRLLRRKLLRPYLYVRCPECTIPAAMRPEDLETEVTCPMCSARYPLGFALAHTESQAAWMYRTPPDIDEDRLLEAIALLATRAALRTWNHTGNATPHIFGAKLTATDPAVRRRPGDTSCEMDLLLFGDFRGQTQVIVGEVKHRCRVEEADLNNMRAVQEWFASQDIDCWPLFATLRPNLDDGEVELLRGYCETAPRARGTMIVPQFPIILLEPELSAPWMDDDSIMKWCPANSAGDLAVASCARNLGLQQWSPAPTQNWVCQWAPIGAKIVSE